MSIDNDSLHFKPSDTPLSRLSPENLLLEMYRTLQELKVTVNSINIVVAEEKTKQMHSEKELSDLKIAIDKISDKIEALQISEARTSVKFGVLTFVTTLVFVTAFNFFIDSAKAEELGSWQALPPPKMELSPKKADKDKDNGLD